MQITIRAARVNARISQADAAKKVGITQPTLCKIEKPNGIYHTKFEILVKLLELYGVSLDDIRG